MIPFAWKLLLGQRLHRYRPAQLVVGLYGQSNMRNFHQAATSPPAANAGTMFFNGLAWGDVPAADGIRILLNGLNTDTGLTVGAMNGSFTGVPISLLQKGGGPYYAEFISQIRRAGNNLDALFFHQGEGDAANLTAAVDWQNLLSRLHGDICADLNIPKSACPLFVAGLATATSGYTDVGWDTMERAIIDAGSVVPNCIYSHSNRDATLADSVHWNGASYGRAAARYARSYSTLKGLTSGYPNWHIASAAVVDATTTTVDVLHSLGTDFTPTTGITGFEASGDNGGSWVACTAVRTNATRITLTHASLATTSNRKLRYQYGRQPDVSGAVVDNSALAVPLDNSAGVISPTPLASLPVPTFLSSFILADAGANKTATGRSIGAADPNRKLFAALIGSNTAVPTSITMTPNSGSPVVLSLVVNRPASGPDVFFYEGDMPDGTTTDVNVVFSSNPFTNYYMVLWTVDKSTLNSVTVASATSARAASGVNSVSTQLNVQAGGFILAVAYQQVFTGNSGSIAGEAPDTFTSRLNVSANGGWNLAYDASGTAANSAHDVTATFGLTTAALAIAAVHYR